MDKNHKYVYWTRGSGEIEPFYTTDQPCLDAAHEKLLQDTSTRYDSGKFICITDPPSKRYDLNYED